MSKYDEANAEINRLREANKAAATPVTKIETKVVESNHIRSFISFDNASAAINKLQEVNVYTAAENMKKMADGDLYITSTKEVRDTELFMARAQSIRNVAGQHIRYSGRTYFHRKRTLLSLHRSIHKRAAS